MAGNLYLERLILPSEETEGLYIQGESKCKLVGVYSSYYPFRFFSSKFSKIPEFRMDRITVFYGGNGSGKSTLLNVIAEKLGLSRKSYFNSTDFFEDYCSFCKVKFTPPVGESKIITSDDVFKKMSDVRRANEENDRKRAFLTDEKARKKAEAIGDPSALRLSGLSDFDRWSGYSDAVSETTSKYLRDRIRKNLRSMSNGETAMDYLTDEITDGGLYLLDEPENSLSPRLQLELKRFLEESARFFGCQFVIATHSPILLALDSAKIYDLDDEDCAVKPWRELENIKIYAEFFADRKDEFDL